MSGNRFSIIGRAALAVAAIALLGGPAGAASMIGSGAAIQLLDGASDGVAVTITNIQTGGNVAYYSLNGSGWTTLSSPEFRNLNVPDGSVLDLALDLADSGLPLVDRLASNSAHAELVYTGDAGIFTSVTVNWLGLGGPFSLDVVSATGSGDHLAPVPLPGAALLLGSGLGGLAVLRRKGSRG